MARRLDRVIVVDVEATCWDGQPPEGEESEIIEIGVCSLDSATGERTDRESILVRPERSRVSAFCEQLTSLSTEQVNAGIAFHEACRHLAREYQTRDRPWASWGDYDRRQFERQCLAYNIAYPFGTTHLNVKTLFALMHGLSREVGMSDALRSLALPLEGTHHRGGDDAWNIGAILAALLRRQPIRFGVNAAPEN